MDTEMETCQTRMDPCPWQARGGRAGKAFPEDLVGKQDLRERLRLRGGIASGNDVSPVAILVYRRRRDHSAEVHPQISRLRGLVRAKDLRRHRGSRNAASSPRPVPA